MAVCPELLSSRSQSNSIQPPNFSRYRDLHPDGRRLISKWLAQAELAVKPRAASDGRSTDDQVNKFEAFIYAWISLNGWAACVTGRDTDRQWLDALLASPALDVAFTDSLRGMNPVLAFHTLLPIFSSKALRQSGVPRLHSKQREEIIKQYRRQGVTSFQPACLERHEKAGEELPLDWPHTLAALYQVRCNLFHGEKALDSENDRKVVSEAVRVLLPVVKMCLRQRDAEYDGGQISMRFSR